MYTFCRLDTNGGVEGDPADDSLKDDRDGED